MPQLRHDDEKCWKRRTQLEKRLIVGSSILAVLVLIFLLIIAFRKSCVVEEEECTTQFCVQAAAELLDYVDLKQDPCKDFYKFTCGTYYKNAVKKDATSPWTSTITFFENELKSLVVDPVKKKDTNAQIAMKQFYKACMNETAIDEDNNGKFMEALDALGGWPMVNGTNWNAANFDWADWFIKAKQMGLPVIGFFGFKGITKDERVLLRVTGPELDFDTQFSLTVFTKMMKDLAEAFDVPYDNKVTEDINTLIKKIFPYSADSEPENLPDDDDDDDNDDKKRKVKRAIDDDIEEEEKGFVVGTMKNLTQTCSWVPWLKILNGISGNHSQFEESSEVVFYEGKIEPYCRELGKLLKETHPRVIANYYIWTIIHNAHIYMDKDIRRIYEDYADEGDDRFKLCYEGTEKRFKYVRETIYVRKKTTPKVKEQLQEMIDIMKDLYVEHITKCDWMDSDTRKFAIEKVHKITSVVGADDELYDIEEFDKYLGVDGLKFTSNNMFKILQEKTIKETHHIFETFYGPVPEDWPTFFKNAVEVNAFFLPLSNMMIVPAPILISIFYNKNFPAFMNYGFMGSTVAHEFMHGFSRDAREVEWENGTVIDWWTNATEKGYSESIQCVIDEYEGIPFRYRLNGTLTLNENVADYVGSDLGYEAYMRYVKKHGVEMKLPGVPLTPEQIYWVKTSTNYCFRKLDDNSVDYEEPDVHAIPAFRTQAPAKNSKYFAESFNCPVGTPMNPEKKCRVL